MKGAWYPMAGKSSQSVLDHKPGAEPVPEVDRPDSPSEVPALSALCHANSDTAVSLASRAAIEREIVKKFGFYLRNPKMQIWDKIDELRPLVILPANTPTRRVTDSVFS